jgi:hypothetical protein
VIDVGGGKRGGEGTVGGNVTEERSFFLRNVLIVVLELLRRILARLLLSISRQKGDDETRAKDMFDLRNDPSAMLPTLKSLQHRLTRRKKSR